METTPKTPFMCSICKIYLGTSEALAEHMSEGKHEPKYWTNPKSIGYIQRKNTDQEIIEMPRIVGIEPLIKSHIPIYENKQTRRSRGGSPFKDKISGSKNNLLNKS